MLERSGYLPDVVPDTPFLDGLLTGLTLSDHVLQITFLCPFHDDEHFIVFDEAFVISDNEVMLQFL